MPCALWCNDAVVRHNVLFIHRGQSCKKVHANIVAGNVNANECCDIPDTDNPLMPWKNPFRNHNTELKHLQKTIRNAQDQQQINIGGHPRQPVPMQTPLKWAYLTKCRKSEAAQSSPHRTALQLWTDLCHEWCGHLEWQSPSLLN